MSCDPNTTLKSEDISNAKANFETIKAVVESDSDTTTTPDGKIIDTIAGAVKKLGWETPAQAYAGGIAFAVGDERKIIERGGIVYAPLPSEIPFTTTGTWVGADENNFYPITINAESTGFITDYVFSSVAGLQSLTAHGGISVSLTPGSTARTQGYYAPGDGGGAQYVIKTTAQAISDGDVIDTYGNHAMPSGNVAILDVQGGDVYVEAFGVSAALSNSGPQHNACADYCRSKGGTLTSLSDVTYTTSESINFRDIRNVNYLAQINGDADFVTVILGGDSTDTSQYYTQKVFKANRGGPSPAVRLVGSTKNRIHVSEASIFEIYADTDSSKAGKDEYTAYNEIVVLSCTTFQINSNASTDGSSVQWINENKIYLHFCNYFRIVDNGYSHNSNQIFGGNFEAADATIILETGSANTFTRVRGENALAITFGANSNNNNIITDWFGFPNAPDAGASVTDNGINNCVKNFNDISNDRVTIMSFSGSSLSHDGTSLKANLKGVATSSTISANSATNTVTTATFQTFYTSPLIEIFPNAQYFDVEVTPKLSGGIKMLINGWDSSMAPIANTGSDVFFQGATNETAGFGEENTTITNRASQRRIRILNTSAKYIEIVVKGSSAGCSFRRFTVEMVTSAVNGKKAALASAMIPNIQS